MFQPTVTVVFNRLNYKSKSGCYPVYLRITIARKSKYLKIPLSEKIDSAHWNAKGYKNDNYIKNTHPFAFGLNNQIQAYKTKVRGIINSLGVSRQITIDDILRHLEDKRQHLTFNMFASAYIKSPKEKLQDATLTKYRSFLKHLNAFNKNIYFADLNAKLVQEFKQYLEVDLNLLGSTIKSYFDKFKKIVTQAEREAYLDYQQTRFLFDDAKIKVNKAKRTYLEIEEVIRLANISFSEAESFLQRTRDLFLFQIYTGFYYNDLKILKKENIKEQKGLGKYIVGERDKNENTVVVPLFKFRNAQPILEKYAASLDDDFLFDEKFFIQDQVYNKQLKVVAERARIKKDISNKVARHTNVQLWVRYGAERPIISKMVGHSKEATTKEYYDVYALDVFEGTKKVNFEELGL